MDKVPRIWERRWSYLLVALALVLSAPRISTAVDHDVAPVASHGPAAQWGPAHVLKGLLTAKLESSYWAGRTQLAFNLTNTTTDFLCIDVSIFETGSQDIRLLDSHGKAVTAHHWIERGPSSASGVDYESSFLILRPRESKVVQIDGENFDLNPGEYRYEVFVRHFRCSDVLDTAVATNKKEIPTYLTRAAGTFSIREP